MTLCFNAIAQQDALFSQYMFNGLVLNPAYAGSREALTASTLIRSQWLKIDGAPVTQTFTANSPLLNEKIGVGFLLFHDQIGVMNSYGFYGSYAYHMKLNSKAKLSLGLQGGFSNYQVRWADITTIQSGDPVFTVNSPNLILPNFGLGTYYYSDKFFVGFSVPHLINNKIDFSKGSVSTERVAHQMRHYFLNAGYLMKINSNIKFKPTLFLKYVKSAPVQLDLNGELIFYDAFWFGGSYRSGDAIVLLALYRLNKQVSLGYSYDFILSELNQYSKGSHEVMLRFEFNYEKDKIISPRYF
ncbi:MAG: type IX secretion system membrane protein PorP/SprF [Bacteroidetes bacterium]|nr:type IX secretion system membrane protein PorP/SprF [Bacteroidota bacterium]